MAVALADFVLSASETAVILTADGFGTVFGAVYTPDALIVPTAPFPPSTPPALQATAVLVVPVTVAVNWTDPAGATVAAGGDIETVMF